MTLLAAMTQRIRSHGPLTIAQYMELALADPDYGYYMRRDPLGAQGDFTTAPEISQLFGELTGAWLASQWLTMGSPQAALVELGPGRGTLMDDILRATKHVPGFHAAISVHLVETSPALKQKQQDKLKGKHLDLHWHNNFDEIPPHPLLLIANEFFDALPIRQYIYSDNGWRERMVGVENNHLAFVLDSIPAVPLRSAPPYKAAEITEYCEAAEIIARGIGSHIADYGGVALIIDYGYSGGSRGDTLQAVKQHRYHDILAEPGTADLTTHVDFDALKHAAASAGAVAYEPVAQGAFLNRLGIALRAARLGEGATEEQKSAMLSAMERLTSPQQMGDLFKVLCVTHPKHPKPEVF